MSKMRGSSLRSLFNKKRLLILLIVLIILPILFSVNAFAACTCSISRVSCDTTTDCGRSGGICRSSTGVICGIGVCGDSNCDSTESCTTCSSDCGSCPPSGTRTCDEACSQECAGYFGDCTSTPASKIYGRDTITCVKSPDPVFSFQTGFTTDCPGMYCTCHWECTSNSDCLDTNYCSDSYTRAVDDYFCSHECLFNLTRYFPCGTMTCSAPNAQPTSCSRTCSGSSCRDCQPCTTCLPGYTNANNDWGDGCEAISNACTYISAAATPCCDRNTNTLKGAFDNCSILNSFYTCSDGNHIRIEGTVQYCSGSSVSCNGGSQWEVINPLYTDCTTYGGCVPSVYFYPDIGNSGPSPSCPCYTVPVYFPISACTGCVYTNPGCENICTTTPASDIPYSYTVSGTSTFRAPSGTTVRSDTCYSSNVLDEWKCSKEGDAGILQLDRHTCNDNNACTTDTCSGGICVYTSNSVPEICNNGVDDDCDGAIDMADSNCQGEICDGVDNDGDGLVDEALTTLVGCDQDGYCSGAFKTCTASVWGSCSKVPGTEICSGGIDEDCDTYTDCSDSNCVGNPSCVVCVPEVCGNGVDDDCDGAFDCSDSDCGGNPSCVVCVPEVCGNGVDDDCDGDVDLADDDCCDCSHNLCSSSNNGLRCDGCSWYSVAGVSEVCNDGSDNNCNGLIDCSDSDCSGSSSCCVCSGFSCGPLDNGLRCDGCSWFSVAGVSEVCNDGSDNNCNGLVDCSDLPFCLGRLAEVCGNGLDDDCDGFVDSFDSDCCVGFDSSRRFFEVRNGGGLVLARVDQDGVLWLRGVLRSWVVPFGSGNFVVEDSSGSAVLWISGVSGDLYLRGSVSVFSGGGPSGSGNFVVEDSSGGSVLWVSSGGGLFLRDCIGYGKTFT